MSYSYLYQLPERVEEYVHSEQHGTYLLGYRCRYCHAALHAGAYWHGEGEHGPHACLALMVKEAVDVTA